MIVTYAPGERDRVLEMLKPSPEWVLQEVERPDLDPKRVYFSDIPFEKTEGGKSCEGSSRSS